MQETKNQLSLLHLYVYLAAVQFDVAQAFIFSSTTCFVSHIIYYSYVFRLLSCFP